MFSESASSEILKVFISIHDKHEIEHDITFSLNDLKSVTTPRHDPEAIYLNINGIGIKKYRIPYKDFNSCFIDIMKTLNSTKKKFYLFNLHIDVFHGERCLKWQEISIY